MKRLLLYVLLCIPCFAFAQASLTNDDIVKLTKAGVSSATIINTIKNSPTHFDVLAVVSLKQQGVTDDVITAMLTANAVGYKGDVQKNYRDPNAIHKDGLYYYDPSDTNRPLKVMDIIMASNQKSHGRMASAFTYGLVKGKSISELPGAHSHRQIPRSKAVFYLYVNSPNTGSPNLYTLVRLTEKSSTREMNTGTMSGGNYNSGIDENARVDFDYEQVADGVYKIYLKHPLDAGEYCFLCTMNMPGISSAGAVYDFGITGDSNK